MHLHHHRPLLSSLCLRRHVVESRHLQPVEGRVAHQPRLHQRGLGDARLPAVRQPPRLAPARHQPYIRHIRPAAEADRQPPAVG